MSQAGAPGSASERLLEALRDGDLDAAERWAESREAEIRDSAVGRERARALEAAIREALEAQQSAVREALRSVGDTRAKLALRARSRGVARFINKRA